MASAPPASARAGHGEDASGDLAAGFKGAMRRLASGVAIVVAEGQDGPVGMAATSITSLTMDPPAVLVCVNRSAMLHAYLAPGCPITVNLLSRHQRHVSSAFGGGVPRERRFEAGEWTALPDSLPMLQEAQANLSCKVESIAPYGTHSIVIASVDAVRLSDVVDPLIYQDGAYL
ncbi:flavin reductase family protein [Novosphingobium sp. P6W]|uniref:flavin reductase family protein n=1 Tax=Novosphingobium sp. P6W TaxID=1609758 RepID=UPI0006980F9C|nr:flavin reductase family protein [Novosphingobium sp. P6W]AXB80290.1 flavin reductase [Novosphingobium sp. P6W]